MSGVNSFRFVSPGIFTNEVDNSQLPKQARKIGPAIITRAEKGPAMRPVQVDSFEDYLRVFGDPIAGNGNPRADVWRNGNYTAPTYGAYAAQAWLRNNSPVTVVRLLGTQHSDAVGGATYSGYAGWQTSGALDTTLDSNGGAYGLFIGNISASGDATGNCYDMALAAIFYLNEGSIRLVGASAGGGYTEGAATVVKSCGPDYEFKAIIEDGSNIDAGKGVGQITSSFNFNSNSAKYIRKVFNTNPTLINTAITQNSANTSYGVDSAAPQTDNLKTYWLGETFDKHLTTVVTGATDAGRQVAVLLGLKSSAYEGGIYRYDMQAAQTGWYISQDVTSNTGSYNPEKMTKLFKFVGLESGEWLQRNVKVAITDIKVSDDPANNAYGSFTVQLRKVDDKDGAVSVIEAFSQCNLNPNSANYIGKKIGDMYQSWDSTERRYRVYGNYTNKSSLVRVEMNPDVDAGTTDPGLLPFGFYGPPKFASVSWTSGSTAWTGTEAIRGAGDVPQHRQCMNLTGDEIDTYGMEMKARFVFPTLPLRVSSSDGITYHRRVAGFGVMASPSDTYEQSYVDMVRPLPYGIDSFVANAADGTVPSFVFSLDDVEWSAGSSTDVFYSSGSRANGKSITAGFKYESNRAPTTDPLTASYEKILDAGVSKIVSCFYGGFDGLDITEKEPFRNSQFDGTQTDKTSYAYNSICQAVDSIADPEVVEFNLACMPGITYAPFTDRLITACESRGDALAIIDLESGFIPSSENAKGDAHPDNKGTVAATVASLKARNKNTSYGCAYYPWVQVNVNGNLLWVPPSVVALGTMASSEAKSELWFAPAGFTRGGLSNGAAGLTVTAVRDHLTSLDRDKLYEANINPIAQFPNEGIVVFGQKTLQKTASALDRINVRRLMNYVKKEISRMAATVLFDQNTERTWLRFESSAVPFLRSVQARYGLADFKFVCDKTINTPDTIDRNIMYGKIMLKPTRAVEYIGLSFYILPTGASFDD